MRSLSRLVVGRASRFALAVRLAAIMAIVALPGIASATPIAPTDLGVDLSDYVAGAGTAIGAYIVASLVLVFGLLCLSLGWAFFKKMLKGAK